MIIKCPNCGSRFQLNRRPPEMFRCPKCHYSTSFSEVLDMDKEGIPEADADEDSSVSVPGTSPGLAISESTRVVDSQQYGETKVVNIPNGYEKTRVFNMPKTKGMLQLMYKGVNFGVIELPRSGQFTLGRRSSDSKASIKLTPDLSMSRLHAGMRTRQLPNGQILYQITSVKTDNPVIVNGKPIPKAAICNLKSGDVITMGETTAIFKMV